jgi:hypothetical protein
MKKRDSAACGCRIDDIALRVNDKFAEICCTEYALALTDAGADALLEI